MTYLIDENQLTLIGEDEGHGGGEEEAEFHLEEAPTMDHVQSARVFMNVKGARFSTGFLPLL